MFHVSRFKLPMKLVGFYLFFRISGVGNPAASTGAHLDGTPRGERKYNLAVPGHHLPRVRCDGDASRGSIMNAIGLIDHPTSPRTTPLLVRATIRNKSQGRAPTWYARSISMQTRQGPRVQGR
jgi:hypothetical protein